MAENLRSNALVLYKLHPARITQMGAKKIEIELEDGDTLSVRPKDVELLHPGPLHDVGLLTAVKGEVPTAWELLAGTTTTLGELAELAYGAFTPRTAWAAWQLLADGLYFSGTADAVRAHTAAEVTAEKEARAAKAAEAAAWEGFLARAQAGEMAEDDGRFLQDVIALALGQQEKSQVLRALDRKETPENAHALLLALGYWDETNNPYPARAGVTTHSSAAPLEDLPSEERRDLTHLVALAIDDEGNQDPDDAISWENGRLWVHVADVAALAPPDSPADLEARARGANLYLPEGTVTMLPAAATQALGLGLADVSPALSFALTLTAAGDVEDVEIVPSWVRVTRLSYAEAETQLATSPLRELHAVVQTLEARRQRNGAVHIDLPEVRVRVLEDGAVEIRPLPNLRSRDLVREAMLITGEAVARFAFRQGIPIPFTTQDPPSGELPPATTPSNMLARRRLMQPSQQTSTPGAHAGLGLGLYAQATSPLRRYLDLVVHQQLRAYVRGGALLDEQEVMARVGAADAVSREVRWAERQSLRHWTLVYLLRRPGWRGEGIVVDQRGKHDVVLLPELELETRVYRRHERPLDSTVTLELNKVNLVQLEAHFRVVDGRKGG